MAKDKEKEENKKVTKKVAKKTAKKKVTKKAAKKVAKKTTAKKTVAKKTVAKKTVAKKTVAKKTTAKKATTRKKPAEKKPIKLKEDSKDLDSFAVHAAESADNNKTEVVKQPDTTKQPEARKQETVKTSETPTPTAKPTVSKPQTPVSTQVSTPAAPETTEPYLKRPASSQTTSSNKGEGGLFRLIFVVLLFAGVAYYIDEIYDENQASAKKAPVVAKQVSEPVSEPVSESAQSESPASPTAEVITELKPVEEAGIQPELPAELPVQVEQAEKQPLEEQPLVEQTESLASPVVANVAETPAVSEPVSPAEPKKEILQAAAPVPSPGAFPPPPVPEFLTNAAEPRQVPEDQMQLIMQTFGPAAD